MDSLSDLLKEAALKLHHSKPPPPEDITTDSLQTELFQEQKYAKLAARQKGKKPRQRSTRAELIDNQQKDQALGTKELPSDYVKAFKTVITSEYKPSSKGLDSLTPITLKDLLVGIIHRSNYIVLRTITDPVRKTGIKTIVEDHEGLTETLTLFNVNCDLDDQAFLPINSYVVIRAPYYTLGVYGYYGVRCDHPSDIIILHHEHNLVKQFSWPAPPENMDTILTCEVLKDQGNTLFSEKKHQWACTKYTTALQQNESLKEEDLDMWVALHSNRAVCRLKIFQFEGAISDCEEVLTCQPKNKKAMFLKARAFYFLRRFDKSARACEDLISEYPDLDEANDLLDKCLDRLRESSGGDYDFRSMEDKARLEDVARLDHADYIGPVQILQCRDPAKGRGLFATRDIRQGELLLCEKAFVVTTDTPKRYYLTFNTVRKEVFSGPRAQLPCQLIRFMYDNPSTANSIMQLDSGGRGKRSSSIRYTPEGQPIIDAFTVSNIVGNNLLELEGVPLGLEEKEEPKEKETDDRRETWGGACGVWVLTSHMNHSCLENVGRTFIGDFVIVRAIKGIKNGEELFQSYADVTKPLKDRQYIFKKMGFTCKCALCRYQTYMSTKENREREKAVANFTKFEGASTKKIAKMSPDLAPQVRKHIDIIFHTYSNPAFCTDLLRPYGVLSTLQFTSNHLKGCVNSLCSIVELVAGCDPLADEEFAPKLWLSEYIYYFLYLCIVFELLEDKKNYEKCWEKAKMILGILSGVGYESARIEEAIRCFRHSMRLY